MQSRSSVKELLRLEVFKYCEQEFIGQVTTSKFKILQIKEIML